MQTLNRAERWKIYFLRRGLLADFFTDFVDGIGGVCSIFRNASSKLIPCNRKSMPLGIKRFYVSTIFETIKGKLPRIVRWFWHEIWSCGYHFSRFCGLCSINKYIAPLAIVFSSITVLSASVIGTSSYVIPSAFSAPFNSFNP